MGPGSLKSQACPPRRTGASIVRLSCLGSLVAVFALLVLAPGAASAAGFSWGTPTSVGRAPFTQAGPLSGISCPSTSLCVGVDTSGDSVISTDPTAATPAWTNNEIDPLQYNGFQNFPPGLNGVSCPSTSLCVAVDSQGLALVSTDPTATSPAWTTSTIESGFKLTGISCASTALCVAVDASGNAVVSTDPTATSPSWTTYSIDGSHELDAVTCPSTALCVAADDDGRVLISTNPTSPDITWTAANIAGTATLTAVSCPSTSLCVAAGNDAGPDPAAFVSTDPTSASPIWKESRIESATSEASAVSCVSSSLCVAGDGQGNLLVSTDPASATPTWTTSDVDDSGPLTGLSCISGSACLAADATGRVVVLPDPSAAAASPWSQSTAATSGLSAVSCTAAPICAAGGYGVSISTDPTAATPTWSQSAPGVSVNGVSCASTSFCAAVDFYGRVLVSTDPTAGTPTWTTTSVDSTVLAAVSCGSASFCAAVDDTGNVLVSTDPTSATPTWTSTDIDPGRALGAISCESTSLCVALQSGNPAAGVALISTDPSAASPTWTAREIDANPSSPNLSAVSCPTASLCVAVDTAGDAVITTDPSAASPTWRTIDIDGDQSLVSVSCASASSCEAVDSHGNAVVLTNPASAAPTWQAASLADPGTAGAISCPGGFCVVVDSDGNALATTTPAAGAPTWTTSWVDGSNPIAQTSCPSTSFCAAVDGDGNVLISTDPTTSTPTWATTNIDGAATMTGISCASASFCVAIDDFGNVLISTDPTDADPSWASSSIASGGLTAVSCPSTALCVVTGSNELITTDPTNPHPTWRTDSVGFEPDGISCPSTALCATFSFAGNLAFTTDPTAQSPSWTSTTTSDSRLVYGISCPSALMCAEAGLSGDVWYTTDPTAQSPDWTDDGGTAGELGGISCPSVGFCVAAYDGLAGPGPGNGLVILNPASPNPTLTPSAIDAAAIDLPAISCASVSLCVAGGSDGRLIVGQGSGFPSAPVNTALPTIQGTAAKGVALTATPGSWTNEPATFLYQWERCSGGTCTPISSATGQSYTPTSGDVGDTLEVQVTASDVSATSAPAGSAPTGVVSATPPVPAIVPGAPPTISGVATQGQTLTETHGSWTNSPTSYSYQWQDCDSSGNNCSAITGAIGQTYTLAASDVGDTIRVQETATNAGGHSSPASSAPTGIVQSVSGPPTGPSNSSPPVVSGETTAGQTLTTSAGAWGGTPPISYAYQWQLCNPGCGNIAGATSSSLTLTTADVGDSVRVLVTGSNIEGSAEAASSEVGPIVAATSTTGTGGSGGGTTGTGGAGGPTIAQVKAALLAGLAVSGRTATIARLLRNGGYASVFNAPSAGRLIIHWYYVPKGAHLATVQRPELVASANVSLRQAGKTKLKIRLTTKGRHMLKHAAKHLRLTAKGSFTPAGDTTTSTTKAITV